VEARRRKAAAKKRGYNREAWHTERYRRIEREVQDITERDGLSCKIEEGEAWQAVWHTPRPSERLFLRVEGVEVCGMERRVCCPGPYRHASMGVAGRRGSSKRL